MTAITVTSAQVALIKPVASVTFNAICNTTITKGELVFFSSSNGRLARTSASGAGTAKCVGMALESGTAGQTISVLQRGLVYGATLSGNYGADVYASDTTGGLDTAAGTVSLIVGKVFPMPDNPASLTKVLYINAPSL